MSLFCRLTIESSAETSWIISNYSQSLLRDMANEAEIKFWRTPDLLEKLVYFLDTESIINLIKMGII